MTVIGAKASPGAWPAIVGFPTHSELSAPRAIRLILIIRRPRSLKVQFPASEYLVNCCEARR
jgi:hypothetical protein